MDAILSVASLSGKRMKGDGFDVDLYLILDASLSETDRQRLMAASAAIEVWDDATPFHEAVATIHRQHRFVIKDKLLFYDLFVVTDDSTVVPQGVLSQHLDRATSLKQLQEKTRNHRGALPTLVSKSGTTTGQKASASARTLSFDKKNVTAATGWIATPSQIFQWHTRGCPFLPPLLAEQDSSKPGRFTT